MTGPRLPLLFLTLLTNPMDAEAMFRSDLEQLLCGVRITGDRDHVTIDRLERVQGIATEIIGEKVKPLAMECGNGHLHLKWKKMPDADVMAAYAVAWQCQNEPAENVTHAVEKR